MLNLARCNGFQRAEMDQRAGIQTYSIWISWRRQPKHIECIGFKVSWFCIYNNEFKNKNRTDSARCGNEHCEYGK